MAGSECCAFMYIINDEHLCCTFCGLTWLPARAAGVAGPVTDATWKELVLESKVPVLVDFWAPWCGPCRMIAPLIDEIAQEYGSKIVAVRPPVVLQCIVPSATQQLEGLLWLRHGAAARTVHMSAVVC